MRLLAVAWFVLVGGHLVVGVLFSVSRVSAAAVAASRLMRESALGARERLFGSYARDVEFVRRAILPGESYYLAGRNDEGQLYFLAYDLAPRRPILSAGNWLSVDQLLKAGLTEPARYVVVVDENHSLRMLGVSEFFGSHRP